MTNILDGGPVILQNALAVKDDDTEVSLAERVHSLEHKLYPQAIDLLVRGRLFVKGRKVFVKNKMVKTEIIRFGTSGWRAIIADKFTFENVRLVSQAIADHLKNDNHSPKVVIGYDTRFLSGNFAKICAQVLAENKIKVLLSDRDTPTPVIAYHIIAKSLDGGINFTASHNPPEYNGIKFSPSYGGPAPKEVTAAIEQRISFLQKNPDLIKKGTSDKRFIEMLDPSKEYLKRLNKIIDISCIKKAKLKVGIDCMFGTSRKYIDSILKDLCKEIKVFKNYLNPLFGGLPPEPDKPYIQELIKHVKNNKFHLGVSCDGDADRFGIVDKGEFSLLLMRSSRCCSITCLKQGLKLKKLCGLFLLRI